jgi:hypothetical protein
MRLRMTHSHALASGAFPNPFFEGVPMSIPTFEQLNFTSDGHTLVAETAIDFQQTSITIKAEIPNENHPLRLARLLVLRKAQWVIGHAIEQEQGRAEQEWNERFD